MLLENIIEYILNKADFTRALRRTFDFRSQQILLQNVAEHFKRVGGYIPINDLLDFIISFLRDKGLDYNASEILNRLFDSGILVKSDDIVSFKYRCFQEFFVAQKIFEDQNLYAEVFDKYNYLRYAREIDMMTGLYRTDNTLLEKLSENLDHSTPSDIKSHSADEFGEISVPRGTTKISEARITEIRKKVLTTEEIDDLMDAIDRQIDISDNDTDVPMSDDQEQSFSRVSKYFSTLDLYGRAIRNSEFIEIAEKRKHSKNFLDIWTLAILTFIDSAREFSDKFEERRKEKGREMSDKQIELVSHMINIVIPVLASNLVYEQIGTEKLMPVFHQILSDETEGTGRKVLTAFLLLDLRQSGWDKYWKRFIKDLRKNKYVMRLCVEKLWFHYKTRPLDSTERQIYENLIGDIEISLGLPKLGKGKFITELRKKGQNHVDEEKSN